MNLSNIRVLYRDVNCQLYGLPYDLRPGQSPRDLQRAGKTQGWIWLGGGGWWGNMSEEDQRACQAFLSQHADVVPRNPYEYSTVPVDNPRTRFTWEYDGYIYEIMDARGKHLLVADYRYGTEYVVVDTKRLAWSVSFDADTLDKARLELERRSKLYRRA